MVTFYSLLRQHWQHVRTSNIVESSFSSVGLHTDASHRYKRVEGATALILKMLRVSEKSWRKLNAPELLPLVASGHDVRGWDHAEVRAREEQLARSVGEGRRLKPFTHLLTMARDLDRLTLKGTFCSYLESAIPTEWSAHSSYRYLLNLLECGIPA